MNSLMILVGTYADNHPYAMDFASYVAGLAMESDRRVLFAGTAQATLAVGTAFVGKQQGRTVEGGERRPSPMVLFGIIQDTKNVPDPLCRDSVRQKIDSDEERPEQEGGFLSDLIDFGVMDLADGMDGRIIPQPIDTLVSQLNHILIKDRPSHALVIGHIPNEMIGSLSSSPSDSPAFLPVTDLVQKIF